MTKTESAAGNSSSQLADRRRFERIQESAEVEIAYADPLPATVDALLIESSEEGFRIQHECSELVAGLQIFMRRKTEQEPRRARIIWSHVRDGKRVSGCFLL
jgi:transcriptional regulator